MRRLTAVPTRQMRLRFKPWRAGSRAGLRIINQVGDEYVKERLADNRDLSMYQPGWEDRTPEDIHEDAEMPKADKADKRVETSKTVETSQAIETVSTVMSIPAAEDGHFPRSGGSLTLAIMAVLLVAAGIFCFAALYVVPGSVDQVRSSNTASSPVPWGLLIGQAAPDLLLAGLGTGGGLIFLRAARSGAGTLRLRIWLLLLGLFLAASAFVCFFAVDLFRDAFVSTDPTAWQSVQSLPWIYRLPSLGPSMLTVGAACLGGCAVLQLRGQKARSAQTARPLEAAAGPTVISELNGTVGSGRGGSNNKHDGVTIRQVDADGAPVAWKAEDIVSGPDGSSAPLAIGGIMVLIGLGLLLAPVLFSDFMVPQIQHLGSISFSGAPWPGVLSTAAPSCMLSGFAVAAGFLFHDSTRSSHSRN